MHLFFCLFAILLSYQAQADSYCQLEAIANQGVDMGKMEGTLQLIENKNKTFTLITKGQLIQTDEEPASLDAEDVCENPSEITGESLTEEISKDEALQYLEKQINEKPLRLRIYAGKNFSEDGSGLLLLSLEGVTGKRASLVHIGWMPALCK